MKPLTDKQLDLTIARMLRWGVTLAAAVVFVGGVISMLNPGAATLDYSQFRADSFPTIAGIFHGAFHLNPVNLIQVGILILIGTPVLRVVFCIAGFARQRDALYVAISTTVLLILLYSLLPGGK